MTDIYLISLIGLFAIFSLFSIISFSGIKSKIEKQTIELTNQKNNFLKIQSLLKQKSATNSLTENAEIVYQDLLQNIIPIMAALDIMPRSTSEHSLWRSVGSILDEYSKNPYIMEQLRRSIKQDAEVARCINNYINRAMTFLNHITMIEPAGILATTFKDGLLGQSIGFFEKAKSLVANEEQNNTITLND